MGITIMKTPLVIALVLFLASSAAAQAINAKTEGAKGDTLTFTDGKITAGMLTKFNSASATFVTPGDLNKQILIRGADNGTTVPNSTSLLTTISGWTDAHDVTLAHTAANAVTGATWFYGTDDSTAIGTAVTAAAGNCLYFPNSAYWINSASAIPLTNVCIYGDSPVTAVVAGANYINNGSVFVITDTAGAPFNPGKGFYWRQMNAYWPAQDSSTSTPVTYPALFEGNYIANGTITDSVFVNPFVLVKVDSGASGIGAVNISGIGAYCIKYCIDYEGASPNTVRFEGDNFYSSYYASPSNLAAYTAANGEFAHLNPGSSNAVGGLEITGSTVVYGYRYGVRVVSGLFEVSNIVGSAFDGVATALSVEGSSVTAFITFSGNYFYSCQVPCGGTDSRPTFDLESTSRPTGPMTIVGNTFAFSQGNFMTDYTSGTTGTALTDDMTITGNTVSYWGRSTSISHQDYFALNISDTGNTTTVSGNRFFCQVAAGNTQSGILAAGGLVNISGNSFTGCTYNVYFLGGVNTTLSGNASTGTATTAYAIGTGAPGNVVQGQNYWDKPTPGTLNANFGTGATIAGTDQSGRITVGTLMVTPPGTLTFFLPWPSAPYCSVFDETTAVALQPQPTTTTLVINGTFAASDKVSYQCSP